MLQNFLAPLNRRLILLVASALLPAVILGVIGVSLLTSNQHLQAEHASIVRVRAVISAVDTELQASMASAQVLANLRHLDDGRLKEFRDDVRRILPEHPSWDAIALLDNSGMLMFSVHRRFDEGPTRNFDHTTYDRVLTTRQPIVGNVIMRGDGTLVFGVAVPVVRRGELLYVLSIVQKADTLLALLNRQKMAPDAVMTIFDNRLNIVARTRGRQRFAGRPVAVSLQQLMNSSREGFGPTETLEGDHVYSAFARSDISDWGVAMGFPMATLEAPLQQSYVVFGLGAALSLCLGLVAAVLVARSIARPIMTLGAVAETVGHGELPEMPATAVPEVRRVAAILLASAEEQRQARAEREEMLRREQSARAAAESESHRKDEFLAMLGHELRNPVAAISNAASILGRQGTHESVCRDAQQILERQVSHMARLMDDLFDVARVTRGKIALESVPLDLADAVRRAVADFQTAGQADRHSFVLDLSPTWVEADRHRIEQVVVNLLANAVKYSPEGTEIAVRVSAEGGDAVLRVRDQGIGISPELMPQIFDLFVQGEQTLDRAPGGLGIGLSLARRLVELHNGSIGVESEGSGKGSAFTVRLPLMQASPQSGDGPPSSAVAPRRILLVEDTPDVRESMRMLLEMDGHAVDEAGNGQDGFDKLMRQAYDVAFVDIGLPGLNGYELARRVRAAGKSLRLVALSGYGQPEDRRQAIEAGFDLHLTKPVGAAALMEALNAGL